MNMKINQQKKNPNKPEIAKRIGRKIEKEIKRYGTRYNTHIFDVSEKENGKKNEAQAIFK